MLKQSLSILFIILFASTLTAQTNDTATYLKEWKEINALTTEKNLPKSALAKVQALYKKAKQANNSVQVIKTLIYQITLQQQVGIDEAATIKFINKEIVTTKNETVKSILQLMLANAYADAYRNDKWTYDNRSTTEGYTNTNYKTWSKTDFSKKIISILNDALKNKSLLQSLAIKQFDAILLKGESTNLRPSLYDVMAFNAINCAETFIDEVSLNNSNILSDYAKFIKTNFADSINDEACILVVNTYQSILQFHANSKSVDALIDADINRIEWANKHFSGESTIYLNALKNIITYGKDNPVTDEAFFILANHYYELGKRYDFNDDTTNRYKLIEAKKIIDKRLIAQPKPSSGRTKLINLNKEIEAATLSAKVERFNLVDKPFRLLVSFKNVSEFYYRIIKINKNKTPDTDQENFWRNLKKFPIVGEFIQQLPMANDYQEHSTEVKINALPFGEYVIFGSNGKDFNDTTNNLFSVGFTVTNLACITTGYDNFVLHRETGQPIENASIVVTEISTDKNENKKVQKKYSTNKNGYAKVALPFKAYTSYSKKISFGLDVFEVNSYYNNYEYNNSANNKVDFEKNNARISIFTDRSIYRPGQKVFFKALIFTKDALNGKSKLFFADKPIKILLKDVNKKVVDSIKLTQNAFGSINATFQLPKNGLTGNFSLSAANFPYYNNHSFKVEEYKRPTFFIEFDKIKESYKLGDSVKITGFVKAYAGNNNNNAKVKYTVERSSNQQWDDKNNFYSRQKLIAQGETKANDLGGFEFNFKANPDSAIKYIDKNNEYDFTITATVTDINGETREETQAIIVGYKTLNISAEISEKLNVTTFTNFLVTASNLNGEKQAANIQVKIIALATPERAIKERFWEQPDMFVLTEKEFVQHFPYDEYKQESKYESWQKLATVFETTINTNIQDTVYLQKKLPQGVYAIELTTTDKFGESVQSTNYTEIFSETEKGLPSPNFNWQTIVDEDRSIKPSDTATIVIGSSLNNVFIIQNLQQKQSFEKETEIETSSFSFIQLNNEKKAWQYVVQAKDKGGFAMQYAFVKHNRFYTGGNNYAVPFTEKMVNIELASFRNKTEPGSKETWNVKIKNTNNSPINAELLTSMYDASLDQFIRHNWFAPNLWLARYNFKNSWQSEDNFSEESSTENYLEQDYSTNDANKYAEIPKRVPPLWWLNPMDNTYKSNSGSRIAALRDFNLYGMKDFSPNSKHKTFATNFSYSVSDVSLDGISQVEMAKASPPRIVRASKIKEEDIPLNSNEFSRSNPKIQPRKNFNETAFFFPNLYADTAGNYTFSFTIPEALTQWKWLSFAHTKDLAFGTNSATITTQKTLMVQPNAPRFMREGDNMEFVTKVANLSDKELTGQCTLELIDATTSTSVDGWFQNSFPTQYFTVAAGQSTVVKFPIQIPFNYNKPLTWRVIAKAPSPLERAGGEVSDGEENTLPVLTNRMLVTESLPLYLKSGEKEKSFSFNKLINTTSESLNHEGITVEYTANPIWSVVQSLPYLMEYPYECAEQTFNRMYANALASSIVNKYPKIKVVFEKWKKDTTAFKSNLQKNEELKQVLLQETPWVLNAESEEQKQKNIALLFDVVKMSNSINEVIEKLQQLQTSNGGFAWFKGGYASRYITNYILTGIGKLKKINALTKEQAEKLQSIADKALSYMDQQLSNDYNEMIKNKVDLNKKNVSSTQIQYLYMRSFYTNDLKNRTAYNYFYNQAKQYWNKQNSYHSALIGLVLYRNNERRFVNVNILPSIIENAIEDTTTATIYWKDRTACFWYASPIEHQSTLIEFLTEVAAQDNFVGLTQKIDAAKTWLILNKQTNNWQTTVATADACYALLNTGTNWINNNNEVQIKLGTQTINSQRATNNEQQQTSNGYIKQRIPGDKVKPTMGNITISTNQPVNQLTSSPSYGAVYWQYFEDLDKITEATSPLSLKKKLFVENNTDKGKVLQPVNENDELKVGDKIVVRIELTSNRTMEYLHLKDMRASGTEPVNVLSTYKWQDGLGYYEATKDASTNFFIDRLEKGTCVFEYPLYVTHTGTFSVGIANIQCMYAPEFTSHSQGIKIRVVQ